MKARLVEQFKQLFGPEGDIRAYFAPGRVNLIDVIVVSDLSKLKILTLLPTAFTGWHTHFKGVHTYQCRHVSIHAERALPVHTDGEPVFLQKSISASCDSKMLQVIVPQRR